MRHVCDFLVIGGGILGVSIARELKSRFADQSVTLIEKENACGLHASGRNSGVLHAGFYYSADSLKARFTRDGNRALTEYCDGRGLRINKFGKLVVAQGEGELAGLDELERRGRANGVDLTRVTAREAREIEPRVKTYERALYSPATASVNPSEVLGSLLGDLKENGVQVREGTAYLSRKNGTVRTSDGPMEPGYVINAAGLYADRIARDYDFSNDYRILPFKGLYLYASSSTERLQTNIYPVPNLENPWLGVHFTVTVDGKVKIGPTATPAFWREHYHGLSRFSAKEFLDVLLREVGLFLRDDFGFRRIAFEELRKYSRRHLVHLASGLVEGVRAENYRTWGMPGIRAQLVNVRERKLEMDFRYEGDDRSFHVLNAVSPGFTCALPFAAHLVGEIDVLTGSGANEKTC